MFKKSLLILLILTLIGLFLRIYPFEAKSWVMDVDAQVVRQALDLGQGLIGKDFSFLRQPTLYPYLTSYLLLVSYGIFYLAGLYLKLFSSTSGFISYIFLHLNSFYWQSRILAALFGAAMIPLAYFTVYQFFGKSKDKLVLYGALLASWLVAFSLLLITFSQQIRPHIIASFFILLSFNCYLLCLQKKTLNSFLLLGVGVGLAAGALQTGFFAFIFLIAAGYLVGRKNSRFQIMDFLKSFFSRQFLAGLLVFLAAFLIFYPYVFFNFQSSTRARGYFDFSLSGGSQFNVGNNKEAFLMLFGGAGIKTIIAGLWFNELSLFLLLMILLAIYFFHQKKRPKTKEPNPYYQQAWTGWWAFVGLYTLILIICDNGSRWRLLCSLIPFLCVGAGTLLVIIFKFVKQRRLLIALIAALMLLEAGQALRLAQLITRPYTRDEAAKWIKSNVPSSAPIVFQSVFPNLTPTKQSIAAQTLLQNNSLSAKDKFLLALNDDEYPRNSKTMLDFREIASYKHNDAAAIFNFMKEIKPQYLVLSSRSYSPDEMNNYDEYLLAHRYGQLIKKFTPFKNNQTIRSVDFPSGFDNSALITLMACCQLGPTIEIYQLDW